MAESNEAKERVLSVPVVTNLDWLENGKISLSFNIRCLSRHQIEQFQMYYAQ